jgi:hypothetical protein
MAGSKSDRDSLVEVLKEIRDELRAVRTELGARPARMTTPGVRTEVVDRGLRWRNPVLAGGGLAALAIVLGLAMRDRAAPPIVAVAPPISATPAAPLATTMAMPMRALAPPAQAPVVMAAPAAVPVAESSAKPLAAPTPATKQAVRSPAGAPTIESVPVPTRKRVKPDVAAMPPSEVTPDEDEAIAFSPPPRRVRVHRMSYGPVDWEPAKL